METMQIKSARLTASAVAAVAIERWGVADALVTRYRERQRAIYLTNDFDREPIAAGGVWYALSVKRHGSRQFEVIARRRTLGELLAFVEKRQAA
jgi:hypothetical protein